MGSGKAAEKQTKAFEQLPRRYEVVPDGMNADVTSITTPHFRHFEDAMTALEYGPVILEKPICGSLHQCDRLAEQELATGNKVYPVFNYRYTDNSPFEDSIVIELVRDRLYWTRGWRSRWETALGGAVTMHGIHVLDLVVARHGMPAAVQGKLWGLANVDVETRGIIAMQWAGGEMITIGIAVDAEVAAIDDPCHWTLGDPLRGYVNLFERIWLNINPVGAEPPPTCPTLIDGRNSIELLTAVYKSFLYDRWVGVPTSEECQLYDGWSDECSRWYGVGDMLTTSAH
jgi:hypothetical protein